MLYLYWRLFRWIEELPDSWTLRGLPYNCRHCELLGLCRRPREQGWKCYAGCMLLNGNKKSGEKKMGFLDNIKAVPIIDYAQRCGFTLVRKGTRYVSLKEHDSVMIDVEKNCFWRNSVFQTGARGGTGSIIDFAMEFKGYELKEAIREIAVMYNIEGDKTPQKKQYQAAPAPIVPLKRIVEDLELPPKADNSKAICHYLMKERCIDISVVRYFIAKKMLYQDAVYNNCVFVSHKFGCVRSTGGKRFTRDLNGCDYNECFFFSPSHGAKTLVVAESVIDIMSIMTQFVKENKRYTEYCYLALAGTPKLPSLFYHLEKEQGINHVMLAFDNDSAGRAATKAAIDGLQNMNFLGTFEDFSAPTGNDWNDYIRREQSSNV